MIICPNCDRQNPEGAEVCEACYTPLPSMKTCPECGAAVQMDATFCGQCGYNLSPTTAESSTHETIFVSTYNEETTMSTPDIEKPDPSVEQEPVSGSQAIASELEVPSMPAEEAASSHNSTTPAAIGGSKTQLQQQVPKLLHVQTNQSIELPQNLSAIHMGKPNDRVPPDIDVSGFPNSDVVSRVHADIRVEGDGYYIEDTGSANGTYINNVSLPVGNRHRLRPGDRIALGKHDLVTFLFQLS